MAQQPIGGIGGVGGVGGIGGVGGLGGIGGLGLGQQQVGQYGAYNPYAAGIQDINTQVAGIAQGWANMLPQQQYGAGNVQILPTQTQQMGQLGSYGQANQFGQVPVGQQYGQQFGQQYGQQIGALGLGNIQGMQQQQPMTFGLGQFGQVQQQPAAINYGAGINAGTIPAVLPQNFGNPGAAFQQLQQPALNQQQIAQAVPTQQLQQALNQRVAAFGAPGVPQRV